ncbi:MAG TPA: Lrp/AsnC family transcriptional regulator [Puia sp.]|jgi:DNA-binding Lrp family transcriptional regulator
MTEELDSRDIRLLQLLQYDSKVTNKELADKVGMSVTAVYERIHGLEQRGVIRRYVALVDREAIGKNLLAFTIVKVKEHSKTALRGFEREVVKFAEVMECYQLTGQFDFLLKVASRDMKEYNAFLMDRLATLPNIAGVETMFVLSEGKVETAYVLEAPAGKKGSKKPH